MEKMVVFYTKICPAEGQTEPDIIRRAHCLGYELVRFAGWSNADMGVAGNRGPRWAESRRNLSTILRIVDACTVYRGGTYDSPQILETESPF